MTTNKINFISMMFVVTIAYIGALVITLHNPLDIAYLLFITGSFIKFLYLRSHREE